MRAFKRTTGKSSNGDDWVQRREFVALLRNLFFFNMLWKAFEAMDTNDDGRFDAGEFKVGMKAMQLQVDDQEINTLFSDIDANHGGMVLFDEFCHHCITQAGLDDDQIEDIMDDGTFS